VNCAAASGRLIKRRRRGLGSKIIAEFPRENAVRNYAQVAKKEQKDTCKSVHVIIVDSPYSKRRALNDSQRTQAITTEKCRKAKRM